MFNPRWIWFRHSSRRLPAMAILYVLQNIEHVKEVVCYTERMPNSVSITVSHMTRKIFILSASYSEWQGLIYEFRCDCTDKLFTCKSIALIVGRVRRCQGKGCKSKKKENNNKQYDVPRKGIRKRGSEKREYSRGAFNIR